MAFLKYMELNIPFEDIMKIKWISLNQKWYKQLIIEEDVS